MKVYANLSAHPKTHVSYNPRGVPGFLCLSFDRILLDLRVTHLAGDDVQGSLLELVPGAVSGQFGCFSWFWCKKVFQVFQGITLSKTYLVKFL